MIQVLDPTPTNRIKPHERLAADKIGEELAPDAGIWQIYLDEAKEYDDELVTGRDENLNTMLLFVSACCPVGYIFSNVWFRQGCSLPSLRLS